ncbi:unnamed protein product [Arabidopsis thaliana]|uniref:Uncharacterized protein n=1 Tax=Arabidopsis thaliana TaxID=3702 RepID=A0A5S9XD46_ARATH|nr:unnamed protein product [Arabidopsis thaliana]
MDRTTGERQFWPLICTLVSTATWMIYGFLTNQFSIFYVNLFGFGAHFIYFLIFAAHGPRAKGLQIKTTLIAIRVLFVIGTITAVAFGVSVDLYVLGWVCVALNISTYAAPIITTVRKIFKTT